MWRFATLCVNRSESCVGRGCVCVSVGEPCVGRVCVCVCDTIEKYAVCAYALPTISDGAAPSHCYMD